MEHHHFSWVNPLFRLGHFLCRYVYQRLFLLTMNDFFVELHGFSDIGPMFVIELTKKYGSNEPRVRRWDVHPLLSHILWVSENWGYSKKKMLEFGGLSLCDHHFPYLNANLRSIPHFPISQLSGSNSFSHLLPIL